VVTINIGGKKPNALTALKGSGSSSSVVPNKSSPTGYSDSKGQPVSYDPKKARGGGGGGSSSGGGGSSTPTTTTPTIVPTKVTSKDPLTGFTPVYDGGTLLGFKQSSTGAFVPKETTMSGGGSYNPNLVTPITSTVNGVTSTVGYSNVSGSGSTNLVQQGDKTYYNVASGSGRLTNRYATTVQQVQQQEQSEITLGQTVQQAQQARERAIQESKFNFTFRDIDWYGTGSGRSATGFTAQQYIENKYQDVAVGIVGRKFSEVVRPYAVKLLPTTVTNWLDTKVQPMRITDTLKLAGASPFMVTSGEIASQIYPTKLYTKGVGQEQVINMDTSKFNIITKTTGGKKDVTSISQMIVKQSGENKLASIGKVASFKNQPKLGIGYDGSVLDYRILNLKQSKPTFDYFIGSAKTSNVAKYTRIVKTDMGFTKLSIEGQGVYGKTFSWGQTYPKGKMSDIYAGFITKPTGNIYTYYGGEATKTASKVFSEVNSKILIQKITPRNINLYEFIPSKSILTQKQTGQFITGSVKIAQEQARNIITPALRLEVETVGAITKSILPQLTIPKQVTSQKLNQVQIQMPKQDTQQRVTQVQMLTPKQETRLNFKPASAQGIAQRQEPIQKLATVPALKQVQEPIQTNRMGIPNLNLKFEFLPEKIPVFKLNPKIKPTNTLKGLYSVQVRRGGKFYNVGNTGSVKEALSIGSGKVGRTLAATFRISGKGMTGTPKGFYSRRTKEGTLFIEQPKYRLSTSSEVGEIFGYKRNSKRRKKK